jgi:hypothetical protein
VIQQKARTVSGLFLDQKIAACVGAAAGCDLLFFSHPQLSAFAAAVSISFKRLSISWHLSGK